jgi:gamma-butyrobetaine dioxygenase
MLQAYRSRTPQLLVRRHYGILQPSNGAVKIPELETSFPFSWLRDSCQCAACVHPSTKQKLRDSSSVSPLTQPSSEHGSISYSQTSHALTIRWDPRYEPNLEPHTSSFTVEFLKRYSSSQNVRRLHKDIDNVKWTAPELNASPALYLSYSDIHNPIGLLKALKQLSCYGVLFVTGVPNQETSDLTCELQALAFQFGEIRETFYGRVWDVKNVKNSKNIAYTNLNLDLHMDLL